MSRFFSAKYKSLMPYVPGEQPRDRKYLKLNANESPFPPSPRAVEYASEASNLLNLYPDPDCTGLTTRIAELCDVAPEEVLVAGGSAAILNLAFMAFCDRYHPAAFPEVTCGLYRVLAELNGVPFKEIPLEEDFTIRAEEYMALGRTLFIANPNDPTGLTMSIPDLEGIVRRTPDNVVVIDEAYVDFGATSCLPLIHRYGNLLVTRTFSKAWSLAGARLGFCVGNPDLIEDLRRVKDSINLCSIDRVTIAAGLGALSDAEHTTNNCRLIRESRRFAADGLALLGFDLTDSVANFLLARHPRVDGRALYLKLREKGVLVRHFDHPALAQYNRITVGSLEDMQQLLKVLKEILGEDE